MLSVFLSGAIRQPADGFFIPPAP